MDSPKGSGISQTMVHQLEHLVKVETFTGTEVQVWCIYTGETMLQCLVDHSVVRSLMQMKGVKLCAS